MSVTQSTLTDRTPNILNKDPSDKKPKNDKTSVSLKHEFDPTGLVQRCVIIQRDENGFGLTVSGDNPVFVQLVKEDGAAMRAGVQTGDRIIKVNGTLVTHSNHIEVVKLIKSGSYVALTVLGRPPGLPQIPLEEEEEGEEEGVGHHVDVDDRDEGAELCAPPPPPPPHSPAGAEPCHLQENSAPCLPPLDGAAVSKCSEAEDGDSCPPVRAPPSSSSLGDLEKPLMMNNNNNSMPPGPLPETPCQSPDISRRRDGANVCSSPDTEDNTDTDSSAQCIVGNNPPYLLNPQIIGAEDDYFDSQQEQINGQCSCFQSVDLLKSRPAHLAVFLHHVVSQFDPAPLLCFLYADMHKHTSSKESRRFFMEFHSLFMDRTANLKIPVPETIAAELEKRRLELIPEDLCKQFTQLIQDSLLPDLHKNLEDFRQKRSMGLTLAEDELCKLDVDGGKEPQSLEKECSCAENIVSKVDDILLTSHPTEEEKCQTMQYVILTYMKHLGVKVKEPRGLEHKRARINFLPKIKKSIKPEKEGEEKVKKPRFPNILGPPRRLSRVDSTSVGKAVEMNKQRSPKQPPQPTPGIPEQCDSSSFPSFPGSSSSSSSSSSGRIRGNPPSDGSDSGLHVLLPTVSPTHSSPSGQTSDTSGHDSDPNVSPFPVQQRLGDAPQSCDLQQDSVFAPVSSQFDFSPSNLEQLQEEDHDAFSRMEAPCAAAAASPADVQSEDDQGGEVECEEDPLNWQSLVSRGVLETLTPLEIKRQEVINELFYTERAHLRTLKVLDCVFYQRMSRDGVLPPDDIKHIFVNLEEIIQLHVSISDQMTAAKKRSETSVIDQIGDDLLVWFSAEEEEKMKRAAGTFCSNQPSALAFIKSKKKKDQRFNLFMQEAESNRLCRRLQLKDYIPVEMQRLTKYPLLLDNIAKYTGDGEEREKVKRAGECCKNILNHVNQAVKEAENKQRLEDYQRRLDVSSLKQSESELRNLDLTKRKMVHEGHLTWKINKDKKIELYTILLEDILVLLQKQDERLILKLHGKNLASAADSKQTFSPVIKLSTVLVRPVATHNRSFFVLSMSENGAQIYQLMAQTVSDQRTWQCLITQCADAMKAKPHNCGATPGPTDAERDAIEIINQGMTTQSKDPNETSSGEKDVTSSPDTQDPPANIDTFNGLKSEDEEEELTATNRRGGEEEEEEEEEEEAEVDEELNEAELEAFLDGQLADDNLPLLQQEAPHQCVAMVTAENQELGEQSSKAEDALRTLATLRQVLFNHLLSREAEEKKEEEAEVENKLGGAPECPQDDTTPAGAEVQPGSCDEDQRDDSHAGLSERNGGFLVLDLVGGSEESSTDDDGGLEAEVGIDMRKLLSSSSQTGGSGPNLSRQLMTHLRLLQADLQYLKEVELKYNELRQTHSDTTTDSEDNADVIH